MIALPVVSTRPRSRGVRRRMLAALSLAAFALAPAAAAAAAPPPPFRLALIEGLSGANAAGGEAVYRNLLWAVERVNARGGVRTPEGQRRFELVRYDSKGQVEAALSSMRSAIDDDASVLLQGNSSAVAAALIDAVDKHNAREPQKRVLFLNYAALDPALTNQRCSFWHFRFDAHAEMRMSALMSVLAKDSGVHKVYLLGQDYSFGQAVLAEARRQLGAVRPDVTIAGEDLHPMLRIKDFTPYVLKIKASGADAVITGNFGNDLTLLVKAAREVGYPGRFYTFYGNALGAPAAIGSAGIGQVLAAAEWMPNVPGTESQRIYRSFRTRYPRPEDDYLHLRMQLMIEALAGAIERAGSTQAKEVARALESAQVAIGGHVGTMRAEDHQLQQPLVVGVMDRQGSPGVPFDAEGSGYGFRVVQSLQPDQAQAPSTCRMVRPD